MKKMLFFFAAALLGAAAAFGSEPAGTPSVADVIARARGGRHGRGDRRRENAFV